MSARHWAPVIFAMFGTLSVQRHPERSEGSAFVAIEQQILRRFATQNDNVGTI
jgi:hypothetical protein